MRKLVLAVGVVVGMMPIAAAGDELTATEGTLERLGKTAVWAGGCGAAAGWLVPAVTGLHAVGLVGVGTGVGAPLGTVAFAMGAAACGAVTGWAYFEPERRGLEEVVKKQARSAGRKLMKDAETAGKRIERWWNDSGTED